MLMPKVAQATPGNGRSPQPLCRVPRARMTWAASSWSTSSSTPFSFKKITAMSQARRLFPSWNA